MSTTQFDARNRVCATCRWWSGYRDIRFVGNTPRGVIAEVSLEECMENPTHSKKGPGSTCSHYQRWEML